MKASRCSSPCRATNDEGRVNRCSHGRCSTWAPAAPAASSPGPSAEIRVIHPEFGLKAFTQLMMDTGGVGAVCDPRQSGASRT